jgi:hypothetical protein
MVTDRRSTLAHRTATILGAVSLLALLSALAQASEKTFEAKRFGELHDVPNMVAQASPVLLGLGVFEAAALAGLYLLLRRNGSLLREPLVRIAGALALAWMLGVSLVAPTDGDAWPYVGYGIVPTLHQAYEMPSQAFSGDFHKINEEWGTPVLPSIYGPVWNGYLHLLVGHAPTLAVGVALLKVGAIVFFFGFLFLCARLGAPPALIAVIAVNPCFVSEYVGGVHNDLPATVLALLALLALQSRRVLPAIVLLAAAALIKITFFAVALTVLAGHGTLRQRLLWLGGVLALTGAGVAYGGTPFLHAMALVGGGWLHAPRKLMELHAAAFGVAAFAIVAAFIGNRVYPGAVWSLSTLNAMFYSWYQAWGIPYAMRTPGSWAAPALFIAWPIVQQLIHAPVGKLNQSLVLMLIVGTFAGSIAVALWNKRSAGDPVPAT